MHVKCDKKKKKDNGRKKRQKKTEEDKYEMMHNMCCVGEVNVIIGFVISLVVIIIKYS